MSRNSRTHFDKAEEADVASHLAVDVDELRAEVQAKYAAVAVSPDQDFHFHTGRYIAERCGYETSVLDALPPVAVESFGGVANPWHFRIPPAGERVLDVGSGAGFDAFVADHYVGRDGHVIGIDMTEEMLGKARSVADEIGASNTEFRHGYLEALPIDDGWAHTVIANGVFNLAPDKSRVFAEALRVLRPGGVLQFADIANGASGEEQARTFQVYGYSFLARKP